MKPTGFSLIETIITLVILGLLAGFGAPQVYHYLQQRNNNEAVGTFIETLHHAKHLSVISQQQIIVCPDDRNQCGKDWHTGVLVFGDTDKNRVLGGAEPILQTLPAFASTLKISYRGFPSKHWIRFDPRTMAIHSNGTFTLKYDGKTTTITLSKSGKLTASMPTV